MDLNKYLKLSPEVEEALRTFGAAGLPRLRRLDAPLSCGIGLLHGILLVFIVFMLVPLMLVVVPKLVKYIDDSVLGGFFYKANLLLKLVPTV